MTILHEQVHRGNYLNSTDPSIPGTGEGGYALTDELYALSDPIAYSMYYDILLSDEKDFKKKAIEIGKRIIKAKAEKKEEEDVPVKPLSWREISVMLNGWLMVNPNIKLIGF